MARLRNLADGTVVVLAGTSTVGRDPESLLFLDDPSVSGRHAQIVHRSGRWLVHDNRSTNGTWIGTDRVGPIPGELIAGQQIRFGGNAAPVFEVVHDGPPEPRAEALDGSGRLLFGEDGVLEIDVNGEAALIEQTEDGWTLNAAAIGEEREITVGGVGWRLELPPDLAMTVPVTPRSWRLVVQHTPTLERIYLQLRSGAEQRKLGTRSYGYMIFVLGQRLSQAPDDGWMPVVELLEELERASRQMYLRGHLNMHVLRFRKLMERHRQPKLTGPRIERDNDRDVIRLAGDVVVEAVP